MLFVKYIYIYYNKQANSAIQLFGGNICTHTYTQIAKFMGPTWGPSGSCRPQMGPMLAPCTLLSGYVCACVLEGADVVCDGDISIASFRIGFLDCVLQCALSNLFISHDLVDHRRLWTDVIMTCLCILECFFNFKRSSKALIIHSGISSLFTVIITGVLIERWTALL